MRRRIGLILLAVLLAWNFANPLIDGLSGSLPAMFGLAALLAPANLTGQGVIFYFKFVVAILVFVLLLKGLIVLSGFGLPMGQKYSSTKFLRRIQGVWAEVMVILFFFFLVPLVFLSLYGWPAPAGPPPSFGEMAVTKAKDYLGINYSGYTDRASIYFHTLKDSGPGFLLLALVLWATTTKLIKRFCVLIHGALLIRFFELGRFGVGGSARFQGLIEEWSLRYVRKD
jgi:hypothetical protein